ncbi:MAG TPA: hypothetical protein VGZ47_02380 [Gemmataceae bacterium]|jgi:hypothetical protein|nr:hypothetical protein [Gemmataceae bacterium]
MRRLSFCFLILLLAGCWLPWFNQRPAAPSTSNVFRSLGGPAGSDVVVIEVAVLETTIGDQYINEDLWNTAIEQTLPAETRTMLEENGLRAGLMVGRPPEFLQILTSERTNPNPRRLHRRIGDPAALNLGALRSESQFQIVSDGKTEDVSLPQAQCVLQIQAVPNIDRKLQLQFTPQVQHGERKPWSQLTATMGLAKCPVEIYSALRWEMALDLNEYIVLGARLDHPKSLGCQFFLDHDEQHPVQRMLAIRAGQLPGLSTDENNSSPTVPLASQAARGASH